MCTREEPSDSVWSNGATVVRSSLVFSDVVLVDTKTHERSFENSIVSSQIGPKTEKNSNFLLLLRREFNWYVGGVRSTPVLGPHVYTVRSIIPSQLYS